MIVHEEEVALSVSPRSVDTETTVSGSSRSRKRKRNRLAVPHGVGVEVSSMTVSRATSINPNVLSEAILEEAMDHGM